MSKWNITSTADAFAALLEDDEELIYDEEKSLNEAKEFNIADQNAVDAAKNFREESKNEPAEVTLEVIDADADTVAHMKNKESYIGQMLLQCNSCKATTFIDADKLKANETDDKLYNEEDECPHCHNIGTGYSLLGQVGKQEAENDEASSDEATFDNDFEEQTPEDVPTEDTEQESADSADENSDEEEEQAYNETDEEDDDIELPKLGEAYDPDDVEADDTITLEEDVEIDTDVMVDPEEMDARLIQAEADEIAANTIEAGELSADQLEEDLDLSSWAGSIADFFDTFELEDSELVVKVFNKNGTEVGTYNKEEIPFDVASLTVDTFNTDDNVIDLTVNSEPEDEDILTISDVFSAYRTDEHSNTTFSITDDATDETFETTEISELIEKFGDAELTSEIHVKTLNIYTSDTDVEAVVDELSDEEIEELPDNTDEGLTEKVIKAHADLKYNRITNPNADEYFIAESIRFKDDLDKVYNEFIEPTHNDELIESFKSITGYKDEVDLFLESQGISRSLYNRMLKESADDSDDVVAKYGGYEKAVKYYNQIQQDVTGSAADDLDFKVYKKLKAECAELSKALKAYKENHAIKESVNNKFYKSVKDRSELKDLVEVLQDQNLGYTVKKSINEDYRYDVFLTEAPLRFEPAVMEPDVEEVEAELVDRVPSDDVDERGIVPPGMDPRDVETVTKINRIAKDIHDAILDSYGVDAPANLIAADIIQDLQLVGGAKLAADLEDTPVNQVTKELYNQFNGAWDALDNLMSFITGERISTSQADRLSASLESLDGRNFETQYIQQGIDSDQFLGMAVQGMVPYVDARQIAMNNPERVRALPQAHRQGRIGAYDPRNDERAQARLAGGRQNQIDYRNESLDEDVETESITTAQKLIQALKAASIDFKTLHRNLEGGNWFTIHELLGKYYEKIDEFEDSIIENLISLGVKDVKVDSTTLINPADFTEESALETVANKLGEIKNLSVAVREEMEIPSSVAPAFDELENWIQIEVDYKLKHYFTDKKNNVAPEEVEESPIDDFTDFDECVNEYFAENYDQTLSYESKSAKLVENKIVVSGTINSIKESKSIEFTLNQNLDESVNDKLVFNVTNNISDEVIKYSISK